MPDCDCSGKKNPAPGAPLSVRLDLWPKELRARATVVKDGKAQDLEVSSPVVVMVLGVLRNLGVRV